MKNLLKMMCIAVMLIFTSCSSSEPKSNQIWVKVANEEPPRKYAYKTNDGWYVIKGFVKNGVLAGSLRWFCEISDVRYTMITEVRLPSGITKISDEFFMSMWHLESVNIPSSVEEIGVRAFAGCKSLTTIDIPDGVKKIEDYAFGNCSSLVNVRMPSSTIEMGQGVFKGCTNLNRVEYQYADYSWIVGTWSCTTPYGTTTLKFDGDGQSGSCSEVTYGSYNYGRYSVDGNTLRYKLNGENMTNVIEIHSGNRLYFGGGYYLRKN